jgi:hypothetical protein
VEPWYFLIFRDGSQGSSLGATSDSRGMKSGATSELEPWAFEGGTVELENGTVELENGTVELENEG